MSCPDQGKDSRIWQTVTCFIQNLLTFHSELPPPQLILEFLGIRLNIPIGKGMYFVFRIHVWRWDFYAHDYIFFSAMAARKPSSELMP